MMQALTVFHVMLLLFSIFCSINFSQNNEEYIYKLIPKTNVAQLDIPHIILLILPFIFILFKSNNINPLKHIIILYTYIQCINSIKNTLSKNVSNSTYPLILTFYLIIVYWKLIDNNKLIYLYGYITLFVIFQISRRYIELHQIINDYLISHFIFYITK